MTKEELEALAKSVSDKAKGATEDLVKSSVAEAVKPLNAEIKTLQDAKKAAEDKAKDLEDKVTKLAAIPLNVKITRTDFGKYLGNNVNEGIAVLQSKGFFKAEGNSETAAEEARKNAADYVKFMVAIDNVRKNKDVAPLQKLYAEEFHKDANSSLTDAAGGYLVPSTITAQLIKKAEDISFALRECTVLPYSVDTSFPAEDTVQDANFVGETSAASEKASTFANVPFAGKELVALSGGISTKLLEQSIVPVLSIIADQQTRAIAHKIDSTVLNGISGDSTNFKGLLVAATGVQSVTLATGKYMKDVAYDNFVDQHILLTNEDAANAKYCFSRYMLGLVRKIKDNNGNPIFDSAVAGAPAAIGGIPYFTSEYAPLLADASTASKIFSILGDFKKYYIMLGSTMGIQSDPYTYFANNMVRYKMTQTVAGNPVRLSAFAVLKAGAAS